MTSLVLLAGFVFVARPIWHVVANPQKASAIAHVLIKNREKVRGQSPKRMLEDSCRAAQLVKFLEKFQMERSEDEQFGDEKSYVIKQIKELKV